MSYPELFKHSSHRRHKLKLEYTKDPFNCDGCKVDGVGRRYRCSKCDFDLHLDCALASKTISHPFFSNCSFQPMLSPPKGPSRRCDACEKDVTGFVYHCQASGFDLHPCCANLPMKWYNGNFKLYLRKKMSASCYKCKKKGGGWSYMSSCGNYNLHVACVREMLVESWRDKYVALRKRSRRRRDTTRGLPVGGPCSKDRLQTPHNRSKSKKKKWCKRACLALRFVIAAVLGDPTTLIASVIMSLMS